ncbi:MAG: isoprenylcysteine carboxylmethyltransferase family protein [Caulobacteraceae bacterium]
MSPFFYSGVIFAAWVVSWFAAAIWSRRATARPPGRARALDLGLTLAGAALLAYSSRMRQLGEAGPFTWGFPLEIDWSLTGLVALGLAFTWWARLTLGDLWSGAVVRKEAQVIIRRGPYRLVRHPIYTGLIFALLALAVQTGRPAALVGALLMATGFWAKARLEERFLSAELGEAYAEFRRATPMLIPFWPTSPHPQEPR